MACSLFSLLYMGDVNRGNREGVYKVPYSQIGVTLFT
jgi:hypothetical protein